MVQELCWRTRQTHAHASKDDNTQFVGDVDRVRFFLEFCYNGCALCARRTALIQTIDFDGKICVMSGCGVERLRGFLQLGFAAFILLLNFRALDIHLSLLDVCNIEGRQCRHIYVDLKGKGGAPQQIIKVDLDGLHAPHQSIKVALDGLQLNVCTMYNDVVQIRTMVFAAEQCAGKAT